MIGLVRSLGIFATLGMIPWICGALDAIGKDDMAQMALCLVGFGGFALAGRSGLELAGRLERAATL